MEDSKQELGKKNKAMPSGVEHSCNCYVYAPDLDIIEGDNSITLEVDMPGVDNKSVEITLEKNVLTIHGSVGPEIEEIPEKFKLTRQEYCVGDFERKFTLGNEVDSDNIKASVKNGVLRVTLPKSDKAKPKKVAVTAE